MVLAVQLAWVPAQANSGLCRALFLPVSVGDAGPRPKASSGFDQELFAREKQRFLQQEIQVLRPGDRPETIYAFIEARSEKRGFSYGLSQNPALLEKRATSWKKALVKQKMISKDYVSSGARIQMALMMIHAELHAKGWKDFPLSFLPDARRAVEQRVQSELLAGDVVTAFRNSGFLIDPLHAERFSHRLYTSGGWNWALQVSLSALSPLVLKAVLPPEVVGVSFIPPLISGARFEHLRKLPPDLEAKIRTQGWEAARPELMRHFGLPAHASWALNTVTRVFMMACLLLFLETAYEFYPWMEGFVKAAYEGAGAPSEATVEVGAGAIREELVSGWQVWYEATYQRSPSAAELEAARERMRAIPDEKLLGSGSKS